MELTAPRAILLDLDDTILAFESLKEKCWSNVSETYSSSLGGVPPADFVQTVLKHSEWFWSDAARGREWRQDLSAARLKILAMAMKELGIYDEASCKNIASSYSKLRTEMIEPIPGAIDTLVTLKDKGIKTALITNGSSKSQRQKLERFDLEKHFDEILIEGEQGYGKPDERIYRKALSILEVEAGEAWMVGDNIVWDVLAPQKIGIRGVWVDYRKQGFRSRNGNRPFLSVHALPEIIGQLDQAKV